jgi:hypothetical protein
MSTPLAPDTKAVLVADAIMFLWALLLGVWKYRGIATSADHRAHTYVDVAHRVALFYSFALLLIASFVQLSGFGEAVNLIAAGAMALYFYGATAGLRHGYLRDTDNQFHDASPRLGIFMYTLIVAEIGGWVTLVAGFFVGQIF